MEWDYFSNNRDPCLVVSACIEVQQRDSIVGTIEMKTHYSDYVLSFWLWLRVTTESTGSSFLPRWEFNSVSKRNIPYAALHIATGHKQNVYTDHLLPFSDHILIIMLPPWCIQSVNITAALLLVPCKILKSCPVSDCFPGMYIVQEYCLLQPFISIL